MLAMELKVSELEEYRAIASFHHVILRKSNEGYEHNLNIIVFHILNTQVKSLHPLVNCFSAPVV